MRLVVQIPCLNEENTLPLVLKSIPSKIKGIDEIIVLVIDDGCSDKTVEVAKKYGVKNFVRHNGTRGLGRSFHDGVMRSLELKADIVVNTDGDNQYPQQRIGDLVRPILENKADIVVADRQVHKVEHFSLFKVILQKIGTKIVNMAAGTNIPDAASGFRAYSRESLIELNTTSRFSYCMETIIQAGNKQLRVESIAVETNPKLRESRLFKSTREHVIKSAVAIIRAYIMYRPYAFFATISGTLFTIGLIPFIRYLVFALRGERGQHVQSLILGLIFLTGSLLAIVVGVLADLIRTNRILTELELENSKRIRFQD